MKSIVEQTKPLSDQGRLFYRQILLDNGIRVLLIHESHNDDSLASENYVDERDDTHTKGDSHASGNDDVSTDGTEKTMEGADNEEHAPAPKAVMSICIGGGAGSLADPPRLQGLAHFCEHLLFMGSKAHPVENDYDKYLSERGGASNAFTMDEATVYELEVDPSGLEGAVERTASFLAHPLFCKSSVKRELDAVQSEFDLRNQSDGVRYHQMLIHSSPLDCPYRIFGWGNHTSLTGLTVGPDATPSTPCTPPPPEETRAEGDKEQHLSAPANAISISQLLNSLRLFWEAYYRPEAMGAVIRADGRALGKRYQEAVIRKLGIGAGTRRTSSVYSTEKGTTDHESDDGDSASEGGPWERASLADIPSDLAAECALDALETIARSTLSVIGKTRALDPNDSYLLMGERGGRTFSSEEKSMFNPSPEEAEPHLEHLSLEERLKMIPEEFRPRMPGFLFEKTTEQQFSQLSLSRSRAPAGDDTDGPEVLVNSSSPATSASTSAALSAMGQCDSKILSCEAVQSILESTCWSEALLRNLDETTIKGIEKDPFSRKYFLDDKQLATAPLSVKWNSPVEHTEESMHSVAPKVHFICPVKDQHRINLRWALPSMWKLSPGHNPEGLIGFVLGHEAPGSLLSVLKDKGYAFGLVAGVDHTDISNFSSSFTIFSIELSVTVDGLKNWRKVVEIVHSYFVHIFCKGIKVAPIHPADVGKYEAHRICNELGSPYKEYQIADAGVSRKSPFDADKYYTTRTNYCVSGSTLQLIENTFANYAYTLYKEFTRCQLISYHFGNAPDASSQASDLSILLSCRRVPDALILPQISVPTGVNLELHPSDEDSDRSNSLEDLEQENKYCPKKVAPEIAKVDGFAPDYVAWLISHFTPAGMRVDISSKLVKKRVLVTSDAHEEVEMSASETVGEAEAIEQWCFLNSEEKDTLVQSSEPYFNVPYSYAYVDAETTQSWLHPKTPEELGIDAYLPLPNPFIAEDLTLKRPRLHSAESLAATERHSVGRRRSSTIGRFDPSTIEGPVELQTASLHYNSETNELESRNANELSAEDIAQSPPLVVARCFHRLDLTFNAPRAIILGRVSLPNTYGNPESLSQLSMWVNFLTMKAICGNLYYANCAGFQTQINPVVGFSTSPYDGIWRAGISWEIDGFSDKIGRLAHDVVEAIFGNNISVVFDESKEENASTSESKSTTEASNPHVFSSTMWRQLQDVLVRALKNAPITPNTQLREMRSHVLAKPLHDEPSQDHSRSVDAETAATSNGPRTIAPLSVPVEGDPLPAFTYKAKELALAAFSPSNGLDYVRRLFALPSVDSDQVSSDAARSAADKAVPPAFLPPSAESPIVLELLVTGNKTSEEAQEIFEDTIAQLSLAIQRALTTSSLHPSFSPSPERAKMPLLKPVQAPLLFGSLPRKALGPLEYVYPSNTTQIIPGGQTFKYFLPSISPDEVNGMMCAYYQFAAPVAVSPSISPNSTHARKLVTSDSVGIAVALDLFVDLLWQPCFDTLRTQQQLGYSVAITDFYVGSSLGMAMFVQSATHHPEVTLQAVDKFLSNEAWELLTTMVPTAKEETATSGASFETRIAQLISQKMRPDISLADRVNNEATELYSGNIDSMEYLLSLPNTAIEESIQTIAARNRVTPFSAHKICEEVAILQRLVQLPENKGQKAVCALFKYLLLQQSLSTDEVNLVIDAFLLPAEIKNGEFGMAKGEGAGRLVCAVVGQDAKFRHLPDTSN